MTLTGAGGDAGGPDGAAAGADAGAPAGPATGTDLDGPAAGTDPGGAPTGPGAAGDASPAALRPGTASLAGPPGRPGPQAAARLRLPWALAVALAGGLALTAAFPPIGIWPLAPAGPALLAVALWRRGLRASLLAGLVFGLAFFVPLLSWLLNVAWYAWLALAVAEAVIFAVLAVGQRLLLNLRAWPLAVAGWWVCAEALRSRWPYAFPWGRLAMSQAARRPRRGPQSAGRRC